MRRSASRHARPWLLALFMLGFVGCATGGLPLSELPDAPIAVTYWNAEETRRRAEQDAAQLARRGPLREGVAQVDELASLVTGGGARQDAYQEYPGRLVLIDPRTAEIRPLEVAPPGARAMEWSRDHRYLLFASRHGNRTVQLYEWDRESGEVHNLTRGDMDHVAATYGPRRQVIYAALRRTREGSDAGLYQTDEHHSVSQLLRGELLADDLAWTADGTALVYARPIPDPRRRGTLTGELVVARVGGEASEDRRLVRGRSPVLTPDDAWIVYSAPVRGGWKLQRVRLDGTGRAPIGSGTRNEHSPAVSPDGKAVAYVGEDGAGPRLFIRRYDGSGDRILIGNGSVQSPVW